MRTISTLCASSAATSVSTLGLAFARRDQYDESAHHRPVSSMLDVAQRHSYHQNRTLDQIHPLSYHRQHSLHADSFPASALPDVEHGPDSDVDGRHGKHMRTESGSLAIQKRSLQVTPRASLGAGMERPRQTSQENDVGTQQPPVVTPGASSQTWLRRMSSSISGSRDSSRAPSRPSTSALSHSNASFTFSHADSTRPILAPQTPSPRPTNKLVKQVPPPSRGTDRSLSAGSKLPLPVMRRPATSHQRSSLLRESIPSYISSSYVSTEGSLPDARESQWRHYFTPRIADEERPFSKRPRTSSGIPTPIRRVYPDKKHVPVLVSAFDLAGPAGVVFDRWDSEGGSDVEDDFASRQFNASTPSSPLPNHGSFPEKNSPRRSFSISDLLSSGPQPLWRRPSSSRSKLQLSKRGRPRVVSMPIDFVGDAFNPPPDFDGIERPAKRRDFGAQPSTSHNMRSFLNGALDSNPPSDEELKIVSDVGILPAPNTESRLDIADPLTQESTRRPATENEFTMRPPRLSAALSEPASTVGSESELRSLDDTSTDYQSDHAFDSLPTRTTRSSSGRRGPHIETIFDDSPPTYSSGRSNKLRDFLNDGQTSGGDHNARYRHSIIEEEGSVLSTPVRSIHNRSVTNTPSARPGASDIFASSPPTMNLVPDLDDLDWDAEEEDDSTSKLVSEARVRSHGHSPNGTPASKSIPFRLGPTLRFSSPDSPTQSPYRNNVTALDRTNLFDWSEPQPSPGQSKNSPPRPRTVHGKKDQDSRGSRPIGRRPVSGMHARSHSVPVAPDVDNKRSNLIANKFGTWGVGSKGVTEDWDEDFDFTQPDAIATNNDDSTSGGKRIDSGRDFDVPQMVKASQENVVANIGLLREWGLLIEELKELRIRAVALDMLNGPHAQAWREVDAMVELADQESEEQTLEPRRSPPSSPGFDFDAFEDTGAAVRPSSRRPSIITLSEPVLPVPGTPTDISKSNSRQNTPSRPRKDSELVAQSVIAALQGKRSNVADPGSLAPAGRTKKVPFDTATLRHIVPYVNALKRKVKDALRETEGLYTTPQRRRGSPPPSVDRQSFSGGAPPFRSIFNDFTYDDGPKDTITTTTTKMTQRSPGSATPFDDYNNDDEKKADEEATEMPRSAQSSDDLIKRMQGMSLPASS